MGRCATTSSPARRRGQSNATRSSPDELFIRWFQLATFMPFYRCHSATHTPRREPWVYGEPALSIVRECLRHRRRMIPYFYTLTWQASTTGSPLARPLFWDHPDDRSLWAVDDAYMLGEGLLVAPVIEAGAPTRTGHFPPGRWFDLADEAIFEGPAEVPLSSEIERTPVFARGGTIIPLR